MVHSFDIAGPSASHDYLSVRSRPVIVRTDPRNTCDTTPCTSAPPALTQSAASAIVAAGRRPRCPPARQRNIGKGESRTSQRSVTVLALQSLPPPSLPSTRYRAALEAPPYRLCWSPYAFLPLLVLSFGPVPHLATPAHSTPPPSPIHTRVS